MDTPFIDELLRRTDITALIGHCLPLRPAGRVYCAHCPFHFDHTSAFTVFPERGSYHCFGCGARGTAIDFLVAHTGLSTTEAVEALAARLRLPLPEEAFGESPDPRPLHALLKSVAQFYRAQLHEHPKGEKAREYLARRGLNDSVIETFEIGFAPPGWDNVLRHFGRDETTRRQLLEAGVIARNDQGRTYDRMRERIVFPIHDRRGRIVGFGGRLLESTGAEPGKSPKYLNSPESPVFHKRRELYGFHHALLANHRPKRLLVVEGFMDVVGLAQFGIGNVVATLGTATTRDHLNKLYRTCDEVVFCFDGDRAGRAAATKAMAIALPLMKDGRQARFLFLPEGEDPDSLVRKIGHARFIEQVEKATPLVPFLLESIEQEQIPGTSASLQVQLLQQAFPVLAQMPPGQHKQALAEAVQERLETLNAYSRNRLS